MPRSHLDRAHDHPRRRARRRPAVPQGVRARRRPRRRRVSRACTSAASASSRPRSTGARSATTCSAPAGAPTSGGCATAPTTSPTCSRTTTVLTRRPSATAGTAVGSASWAAARSTATGSASSPSSRSTSRTATGSWSCTDESWTAGGSDVIADDLYDGQTIDARRRTRRLVTRRRDARRWFVAASGRWSSTPAALAPYVGPPVSRQEVARRRCEIWTLAVRAHAGRLRAEPGRLAAVHRARARRAARSGSGTPRCSSTTSSASARCATRRPPTGSSSAAATTSSSPPRPSTASATPRSTGWPGELDRRRPRGGRRALRPAPHRHLRVLRPAAQPAAPQRRVGHQGQLPRPAHRLPAAQRAARLDRRHRRVRALRGVPVRRRGLPRRLAASTWPSSSSTPTAWCRSSCPTCSSSCRTRRSSRRPDSTAIWSDAAVWVPWALYAGVRRPRRCSSGSTTR